MSDQIKKSTDLDAPVSRVWAALTDPAQFTAWFGTRFEEPFVEGEVAKGVVTYPGYEGLLLELHIEEMREPEVFAFSWHPHTIDLERDYSTEPLTHVRFELTPSAAGSHIVVTESGLDALTPERKQEVVDAHDSGWVMQLDNIKKHLSS